MAVLIEFHVVGRCPNFTEMTDWNLSELPGENPKRKTTQYTQKEGKCQLRSNDSTLVTSIYLQPIQ